MDLNLSVFEEPRGVMRIFHLVFAICSFATTVNFEGYVNFVCKDTFKFLYEYPFKIAIDDKTLFSNNCTNTISAHGDFSSDARFYVCTGVLAMLYVLAILVVYTKFDVLYKTNEKIPLIDFILSVILSIFWLSSSAAWANGLSALKGVVDPTKMWAKQTCTCPTVSSTFSTLNVSVILGFLNFFLWAANLWFLYKETKWFQKPAPSPGV